MLDRDLAADVLILLLLGTGVGPPSGLLLLREGCLDRGEREYRHQRRDSAHP
jgi:hypothetical protein